MLIRLSVVLFFFFKQNTAYEMRISDWSSDLCSSDLGATLIGNGPDAMTKITMVGNDSSLDEGIGTCGKDGQGVPVGVGQPTLKMHGITAGGTADRKSVV